MTYSTAATIIAAAFVLTQPVSAQELPPCPSGKIGEWEWNATAERTRIYYKQGEWNLGPDVELTELPAQKTPEIELTKIAKTGEAAERAFINIRYFPAGLTVRAQGRNFPLFDSEAHKYRVGIASQGGNVDLEVTTGWRALSRYSFGVFGGSATFESQDAPAKLEKQVKGKGMLGLFLFPSFEKLKNPEPVAMLIMPENGRMAAWQAATTAHQALAAAHEKGPGC
ncbi:hypothetical protein QWY75_06515 [Pontixanthobacter aestiaquae]|uniref:Uncharacterized protein n=1 Tax=Pontixanthobacter aestiaquae TaxID=1509367 RepID=A0A844Z744_9SPHN|nr:hypothetical protein [Pontixanthobacter aestiaquae]MDN3645854.1 hypothetical protein [Pontixanthobacter aestiaquae]MXO83152.1 hypothetical protein [Pontixanthobacter aestiaquae]